MTYLEKLRDPRWQKKRLEILQRDNWRCIGCWTTTKTLHVHHLTYEKEAEPWDYPEWYLVTLCEDCHKEVEKNKKQYEDFLIFKYRMEIREPFIQQCFNEVFSFYSDLHRLFYLLWELREQEVMELLENKLLDRKLDTIISMYGEFKLCPVCGSEDIIYFEKDNAYKCSRCQYIKKYATNTNG